MLAASPVARLKVNMMTKSRISTLFALLSILLTSCGASTLPQDYEFNSDVTPGASRAYYEIFVRSFADSDDDQIGDFQGLTDKVPYLNELGVGGVWLMPIHPSPTYHGYDVEDYYAINEDFGTLADFEEFVDTAHDANIDVIIDLVINHTSYTHPWFIQGKENFRTNNFSPTDETNKANWYNFYWEGGIVKYEAGFGDWMPDLNLDNSKVREEIANICAYWQDLGVDGFRLDAVKYFYISEAQKSIDFLSWLTNVVRANDSDAYLVGEVWDDQPTVNLYYGGMDSLFNFAGAGTTGYIIDNITSVTGSTFAFRIADSQEKILTINENGLMANFLTNHDMDRSSGMFIMDTEARRKLAASAYLLTPGVPFIYYGEEIGLRGTRGSAQTDANRRLPMQWTSGDDPWRTAWPEGTTYDMTKQVKEGAFELLEEPFSLTNHYKKVLNVRNAYPWIKDAIVDDVAVANNALAALKLSSRDGTKNIYVVHNFAAEEMALDLSRLSDDELKIAYDIFTNQTRASISENNLTLSAYSSVIFEKK
jgi:glycosidase